MHKVRITILKTTFDSELAREYGAAGLGPCPMMKRGQVFYADYAKPDGFCDEAWKAMRFISMYLHLRTAAERIFFISATGFASPVSPSFLAMMACGRSS